MIKKRGRNDKERGRMTVVGGFYFLQKLGKGEILGENFAPSLLREG